MMKINKISIITLTYKNWRLLDRAIESVGRQIVNQKFEIEYLVVDDGTDDFDVDHVTKLLEKNNLNYRVIVNEKNIGTVASFNNAIKKSTGDIIIPLSADDEFYDATVVNDIVNEFERTNAYIITGLRVPMINGAESEQFPCKKDLQLFDNPKALLKRILIRGNIISGASTYYHREIFNKIGFFDTKYRLLEDYPFYIKALSSNESIQFFDRKVIKYGMDGITAVGKINPILKRDSLILYDVILNSTELGFFEKRFVIYSKVMSKKEKLIFSWLYSEQFFFLIFNKFIMFLFK